MIPLSRWFPFLYATGNEENEEVNKIEIRAGGNGYEMNNYCVWGHAPQDKMNK